MTAHWLITKDYVSAGGKMPQFFPQSGRATGLDGGHKAVSIWGPRGADKPAFANLPLDFIVCDDDNNVYYRGMADERAEFQPLDMFATPNDGATTIAYKRGGKWEVL